MNAATFGCLTGFTINIDKGEFHLSLSIVRFIFILKMLEKTISFSFEKGLPLLKNFGLGFSLNLLEDYAM